MASTASRSLGSASLSDSKPFHSSSSAKFGLSFSAVEMDAIDSEEVGAGAVMPCFAAVGVIAAE
jgi:hypothetical protein